MRASLARLSGDGVPGRSAGNVLPWLRASTSQVVLSEKAGIWSRCVLPSSSGHQILLVYFSRYSAVRRNSPVSPLEEGSVLWGEKRSFVKPPHPCGSKPVTSGLQECGNRGGAGERELRRGGGLRRRTLVPSHWGGFGIRAELPEPRRAPFAADGEKGGAGIVAGTPAHASR